LAVGAAGWTPYLSGMSSSFENVVILPPLASIPAAAIPEIEALAIELGYGHDWDEDPIESLAEVAAKKPDEPIRLYLREGKYGDSEKFLSIATQHTFPLAFGEEATDGEALYESDSATELYWFCPRRGLSSSPAGRLSLAPLIPLSEVFKLGTNGVAEKYGPPDILGIV